MRQETDVRLVALGDSHSLYSFAGVSGVKIYWRGPVTMHRAARDGIASLIPKNYRPTKNDVLILSFGEIDCRAHLAKQAKLKLRSVVEETDDLCNRYTEALNNFKITFPGKIALCCIIPVNVESLDSQSPNEFAFSFSEAVAIRKQMNERLSNMGFAFIDFRKYFDSGDGSIVPAFSDSDVHIDSRHSRPIIDALKASLGVMCSPRTPPWPWPKAMAEPEYKPLAKRFGKSVERVGKKILLAVFPRYRSHKRK